MMFTSHSLHCEPELQPADSLHGLAIKKHLRQQYNYRHMLRSIKQLYEDKLGASDGEIGEVADFYFDEQQWVVRYVVAGTGAWLAGRLVLLSPHAFDNFHQSGHRLIVNLTRQQLANGPSIEPHKPVTRQFEEEYNRYYGWPFYWDDSGIVRGMGGFPASLQARSIPNDQTPRSCRSGHGDNPRLRSTKALAGCHIQSSGGTIGRLTDFLIDDKSWTIRHLLIETGHWFSRNEIAISPKQIDHISHDKSGIFVAPTKEAIFETPEDHVLPHNAASPDTSK
jgi:uncharacterized protein YrrD